MCHLCLASLCFAGTSPPSPSSPPAGEYVEALGPFLAHQGVECCCALLTAWRDNGVLLNEALQVVCSLLAHRRFGELLVEQRGVQLLLALPRWVACWLRIVGLAWLL